MAFDQLDDVYRELILDHRRHPRNNRKLENADLTANGVNPFCGDEIHLQIAIDDGGRASEVGLEGVGCSINQATGSMLTEAVQGKTVDQMEGLSALFEAMMRGEMLSEKDTERLGDLRELDGVRRFPVRIKCALLAWSTLDDAIDNYRSRSHEHQA